MHLIRPERSIKGIVCVYLWAAVGVVLLAYFFIIIIIINKTKTYAIKDHYIHKKDQLRFIISPNNIPLIFAVDVTIIIMI